MRIKFSYGTPTKKRIQSIPIDTIVVYPSNTSSPSPALRTIRNPQEPVSVHYIIARDGTLYQCVRTSQTAFHAPRTHIPSLNSRSIGIWLVNLGNGTEPYSSYQKETLIETVEFLKSKYPIKYLIEEKDLFPTRPAIPLIEEVRKETKTRRYGDD